ncbi:MAG: hypothetical protein AUK34_08750 [Ignavibacteria bacterium CG2_30_36_16]|nr:T9SS type A sorting domain-containing protein [Ignavibacteria bacterium]OIP58665.1 MAG: hypothetical protein AUK34_08750 [Ignavibacteria bacterium CG2_30_36_16]PJB00274.1 MAG: hypothetical protein CO127_08775 [Ignavibacteria bacterium CG_4_9_14_3_um_filter_36_18]
MNYVLRTFLIVLFTISVSLPQTSRYHETFDNNNETGWAFTSTDANISTQNGELKFVSNSDEFVYILPPTEASKDNFSFKIKPGSTGSGLEGGGFGRAGFKSLVAILFSDPLFSDSLTVVFSDDIQSYSNPNLTTLVKYPIPANVNSLQLDVIRSGNNLIINAYVNDVVFYNGQLNNVDEGLFSGNMVMMLDPIDGPGLKEWSLDEVDISYNPFIQTAGVFLDEFDDTNSPWFRFGDFDNIAQSVNINGGRLNFIYNGSSKTAFFATPPVGAVKDFSIEVEGNGGHTHDAPFNMSRFFDYKNYTTFFIEDDTLYFGYASNSLEPDIIQAAAINPQTLSKLKFSIEGDAPAVYKAWANDQLVISGTLNNLPERLKAGRLAIGYDRGNNIDAYFNYAALSYVPAVNTTLQTSNRYYETFDGGSNPGWGFLAPNATITVQGGQLHLTSPDDDVIHMILPIGAAKDDFSFKVKMGDEPSGIDGGGFGRMGFKSLVAYNIEGDSISIIYAEDIQSFSQSNVIKLITIPIPDSMNTMQLDATRSGNNLSLSAYANGNIFYTGQLTNVDEGLFYGQMIAYVIGSSGSTIDWSLDEVDIRYNPMIATPGTFNDDFNDINSPWFRFGDLDNLAQSLTINNGRLNFNYSGSSETSLYVASPAGAVTDFEIEIEGGGGATHDAPLSLSRFFDYRNYTTFFIEDDTLYFGYADNAYEPTIIDYAGLNPTTTVKLKFSVQGNSPAVYKVWANDQLVMNGTTNITSDRLTSGHLAFGFDRGNTMDAYFDYSTINYGQFVSVEDKPKSANPEKFTLYQNFPNPFNPSTIIRYSVPFLETHSGASVQNISLKVYDVLGSEVAELVNQEMSPGEYQVQWNPKNLATGIYIYTIKTAGYVLSKKMLLIK